MAKATQEGRLLSIATNLPYDTLLIDYFECKEAISELFEIRVELLREEEHEDQFGFTPVDVNKILGQRASIRVTQEDGGERYFTGIFSNFRLIGRQLSFTRFEATIVPNIWKLTKTFRSRIFQHQSVPDILREVFDGFETKFQLQGKHNVRNICVQYQETDYDFASRIMEEEGIYFYFEHSQETERVVFRDNFKTPEDCPNKSTVGMVDFEIEGPEQWESAVNELTFSHRLDSGKFTYWDYSFQLPTQHLEVESRSRYDVGGSHKMEVYEYPGGYANRFDGIDRGGGENADELQKIFEDNKRTVENRVLDRDANYYRVFGSSDCCTFTAGYRFTLEKHPNREVNGPYILKRIRHSSSQNPSYLVGDPTKRVDYVNQYTCIPHGSGHPEYRAPMKTPKPRIYGAQTAVVTGPAGEEIATDKYGRVKVQFPWHREGKYDADTSCWVRVGQMWASNKWGSMFIPRIGMEVIVSFIGGDPNEPIITGCVYGPGTMPPYDLPDNKTRSTIKSNSSPGGGGFNELRFEDKEGEEQIFIHGEKDLDVRIKNDRKEWIGNDRHLIVKNNKLENVEKDKSLIVGGDKMEDVSGTVSLTAGRDIQEKAGMNYALEAGTEVHIKAGQNVVVESGTMLTLKVGGNFININSGGIFIKGTMVLINSGGAAGPGMGCRPASPTEPQEADTAEAGKKVSKREAAPPPEPTTPTPLAQAMWKASQNGTPFVEV